jgi:hypothetical protein
VSPFIEVATYQEFFSGESEILVQLLCSHIGGSCFQSHRGTCPFHIDVDLDVVSGWHSCPFLLHHQLQVPKIFRLNGMVAQTFTQMTQSAIFSISLDSTGLLFNICVHYSTTAIAYLRTSHPVSRSGARVRDHLWCHVWKWATQMWG